MFIDIHSHCYRRKPPVYSFCTPDELIRRYDKMKVDMAVLLPVVSPEIYMPQSNEDVLEICENHPDRFIPYCNIDPRIMTNSVFARIEGVLEHYKNAGCKEIVLCTPPNKEGKVNPAILYAAQVAGEDSALYPAYLCRGRGGLRLGAFPARQRQAGRCLL